MDERLVADEHGVEVYTRWWPIEAPRAVVVIAHGASEHSARYDRFAAALNAAGFAAAAIDHRGHGRTGAATGAGLMGPGGGQAVIDDLHGLRTDAASRFGTDLPMHVFGHSMGALIGLAYLVQHADGLAGSVLCGFPADVGGIEGIAAMFQGFDASMRDQPAAAFGEFNAPFEPARTTFDWLSRDAAEVDAYIADPFCGDSNPLTWGYLIDLFGVVAPAAGELASISCPVLVIAGDRDPAAGMGANVTALTSALTDAGVTVDSTLYAGDRHELLNETNRDEITADVIGWLTAHPAQ